MAEPDAMQFDVALRAACAGDPRAIGELYREYNPLLRRFFSGRAPGTADDLSQDTWLSVAEGLRGFEGDERGFRSWMFTIAYRRLADHHRRSARRRETAAEPATLAALSPGVWQSDDTAMQESVRDLVTGLNAEQTDIVMLRIVVGLDVEQVAAIVGKSPGAVRVAQHRALQRLAHQLVPNEVAS